MANLSTQAEQIRDLLVERLEAFDPTADVSDSSPLYSQVVSPVFSALEADPFDTDIEAFLLARLTQEFPTVSAQEGDAVIDLLVRPLQLLLEAFKREIEIVRKGQSVVNTDMRVEDAEDLAANFFVERKTGSRSIGTVRVFFSNPTYAAVLPSARFSSSSGAEFSPAFPQFFRPELMLAQRSGAYYYADVQVVSVASGDAGNVEADSVTSVTGIDGAQRCTNLYAITGGSEDETGEALLGRTQSSLTERALNTRRGIRARLFDTFSNIRNMEVVGYGDAEMHRDVITGGSPNSVVCSGISFVIGPYVILFSMFQDRQLTGDRYIQAGDVIDFNYWKFLYDVEDEDAHEKFGVLEVIWNSKDDLENLPTVYILKIDGTPSVDPPAAGTLPGIYPGVFTTAFGESEISISNIPGGITNPDIDDRIVISDGEIHIGGHYDVYLRPDSDIRTSATLSSQGSEVYIDGDLTLVTNGEVPAAMTTLGALPNAVHAEYILSTTPVYGELVQGEVILEAPASSPSSTTDVSAQILDRADTELHLCCIGKVEDFTVGRVVVGQSSGAVALIVDITRTKWASLGVSRGMTLNVLTGSDSGIYKILDISTYQLFLDLDLTVTAADIKYRITEETAYSLFNPEMPVYPFEGGYGYDLNTVIGSTTTTVDVDLQAFGVLTGDTIEITEGDNQGQYSITDWDSDIGGRGPILDSAMKATDSDLTYRIFRPGSGISRPLVRIAPGGMLLQDSSGQSSGYTVPPSQPAGARAYAAFSGGATSYAGLNGFVLPDPGTQWQPTDHTYIDTTTLDADDLSAIEQYSGGVDDCYSNGCKECEDGFVAVVSVADYDPTAPTGHDLRVHVDIALPTAALAFLQDLRIWLGRVVDEFGLGDDFRAFIDQFAPITFSAPDASAVILKQYEICVPKSLFEGCNNVFVGVPEFNWDNEFADEILFEDAMEAFNNGEMRGARPALCYAIDGDALTINSGPNAGSYLIDRVDKYFLYHGGTIQTDSDSGDEYINEAKAYEVAIVTIKGEFPVASLSGITDFWDSGFPDLAVSLPPAPAFDVESVVTAGPDAGTVLSPWEVVQRSATWFFQFMNSIGFSLPEELIVNPDSVLKSLTQSLLTSYSVGHPTCEQIVRISFLEPISVTCFGSSICEEFRWNRTVKEVAELESSPITVPIEDMDLAAKLYIKMLSDGYTEISEELSDVAANAEDLESLVALLQEQLDPDAATVAFTIGEATTDTTGTIKVSTVGAGADIQLRIVAEDETTAFRFLGYDDLEGGEPVKQEQDVWTDIETNLRKTFFTEDSTAELGGAFNCTVVPVLLDGGEDPSTLTAFEEVEVYDSGSGVGVYFVYMGYWQTDAGATYVLLAAPTGTDFSALTYPLPANELVGLTSGNQVEVDSTFDLATLDVSALPFLDQATITHTIADFLSTTEFRISDLSDIIDDFLEAFIEYELGDVEGGRASQWDPDIETFSVDTSFLSFSTEIDESSGTSIEINTTVTLMVEWGPTSMSSSPGPGISLFHNLANSFFALSDTVSTGSLGITAGVDAVMGMAKWDVAGFLFSDYDYTVEDSAGTRISSAVTTLSGVEAFEDNFAEGVVATVDEEAIAQILNGNSDFYDDSGRVLQFVYASGGGFFARSMDGGTDGEFALGCVALGFTPASAVSGTSGDGNWKADGTSSLGAEKVEVARPPPATLFSVVAGETELLYAATASEDPFQVFPGETRGARQPSTGLPRDLLVGSEYEDATTATIQFSDDAYVSPLQAGVHRGLDFLWVYEQVTLAETSESTSEIVPAKADRVVAVTTSLDSNKLLLPTLTTGSTTDFTFLSPETGSEADFVEPGDLVFIEEGDAAGGYTITEVGDEYLTIDATMAESTAVLYTAGNEGEVDEGTTFYDPAASWTSDDVGRYLTIYASNFVGVDGSYQITEVSSDGLTLTLDIDDSFPVTEQNLHWVVARAPVDEPGDSGIDGFAEMVGLRPIRIYKGTPTEWRIVDYNFSTDRLLSYVMASYGDSAVPPRDGYKQPYEIVRPHAVHISSTTMKEQTSERGLYYMDVRARSLGGDPVYNIPKDTAMVPVFGTFVSEGYRLSVADEHFSYSSKEETTIYFSPRFLPNVLDDVEDNKISLEAAGYTVSYDIAPLVDQVQSLLTANDDRILCANPLARHFLPSYVYIEISGQGGSTSAAVSDIQDHIEAMDPEAVLDVSVLEKYLHSNNLSRYAHPIELAVVTHDIDRRFVVTRGTSSIEDNSLYIKGSNRITFYIPGDADVSDSTPGERISIVSMGNGE